MKLSELLEHLAGTVLDDRSGMVEGAPDSVWSDKALINFFNAAQNEFCKRTWVLVDDSTPEVCTITLQEGVPDYPLHKSILRVLSVTPADSEVDLVRKSYEWMRPRAQTTDGYWDINTSYVEQPGRPLWFATDFALKTLRIRPTPRAEDVTSIGTLTLRVARMPVTALSTDGAGVDASPEIPDDHHLALCDYVAWKALSMPNVDTKARADARDFLNAWNDYVKKARGDRIKENWSEPQFVGAWGGAQ